MLLNFYHGNLSLLCHRNFDSTLSFQLYAHAAAAIQSYVQPTLVNETFRLLTIRKLFFNLFRLS